MDHLVPPQTQCTKLTWAVNLLGHPVARRLLPASVSDTSIDQNAFQGKTKQIQTYFQSNANVEWYIKQNVLNNLSCFRLHSCACSMLLRVVSWVQVQYIFTQSNNYSCCHSQIHSFSKNSCSQEREKEAVQQPHIGWNVNSLRFWFESTTNLACFVKCA